MAFQIKVIIFIVTSAILVWVSWPALRNCRAHGFYRFFAWESILALVLLNLNKWFHDPFSAYQIISWLLLIASLYLVLYGVLSLREGLKPRGKRDDPSLKSIEKTTELVTRRGYRYIRHPIYGSMLFGAWGIFLKRPSIAAAGLAVITTFFLHMTARIEESENIRFFGSAYQDYIKKTKKFIPLIY